MLRERENITMRTLHHMSTGPAGYKPAYPLLFRKSITPFFFSLKPAFFHLFAGVLCSVQTLLPKLLIPHGR